MNACASYLPVVGLALLGGACAPVDSGNLLVSRASFDYLGAQTRLLDDDIVQFSVKMNGATKIADVAEYAECVAAQYTLIRGYGFARHVRTTVSENDGHWLGDAFYIVSDALPNGRRQIDAEVVVAACNENEVPTV
jgi:hypothetical protein